MNRHVATKLIFFLLLTFAVDVAGQTPTSTPANEVVRVDLSAPTTPFPHFWEQMFGSGRANLTLRDSYRRDLDWTREITALKYVRFHAIFHDENGVYDEDAQGNPIMISGNNGNRVREAPISRGRIYAYVMPN